MMQISATSIKKSSLGDGRNPNHGFTLQLVITQGCIVVGYFLNNRQQG